MFPSLHINVERWKYNKTFEVYVSNMGHVRNKSKALLAPKVNCSGYMSIHVDGSNPGFMLLHRLVMLTWRPTPEAERLTVDHLDHNKRNNAVANLEWVTMEENLRRAGEDRCPANAVLCIDSGGRTFRICKEEDITKACKTLKPAYGFSMIKFHDIIMKILAGQYSEKAYCSIKMIAVL